MRAKCEKMRVTEKIFSKNFCFLKFLPYLCIVILLRQRDPAKCRPSLNHSARMVFNHVVIVIQRNPLRHTCTSLRRLLNGRSTTTLRDT